MNDERKVFTLFNKTGRHIYQARMKLAAYKLSVFSFENH